MRHPLFCLFLIVMGVRFVHAEAPFRFESTPGKLPKDIVPVQYDLQRVGTLRRVAQAVAESGQVRKHVELTRTDAELKARLLPEVNRWAAGK